MNMRRAVLLVFLALQLAGRAAEPVSMRDVFRAMPDSLLPYLTANNRLDFIDFIDSGMKAEVRNSLGGQSLMTSLTADSLSLTLNDQSRVDIMLLDIECEPIDSCSQVVALVWTVGKAPLPQETLFECYSVRWRKLDALPPLSSAGRSRISNSGVLKVVDWYKNTINKW